MARRALIAQALYCDPAYQPDRFHHHLGDQLDHVLDGDLDRVIIEAPPQHGKSRLASVELPAAWIGRHPDEPIIACSYGAELAYRHSREVQRIVEGDAWQAIWPGLRIDRKHAAVHDWGLEGRKGGLVAAGVGGPITGRGAALAIVDDPVKNWREAQSLTVREAVWDWWRSTLLTRVWDRGRIVVIATRWHPDDLIGRLLEQEGDRWVVLHYPAVAESPELAARVPGWRPDSLGREAGQVLAPRRFSLATIQERMAAVGPLIADALYQQRPALLEGNVLKVDQIRVLDAPPDDVVQTVRFWDLAATPEGSSGDPDFTAGVLMGRRQGGRYVILDVQHGRWAPEVGEAVMRRTAEVDGQSVRVLEEQEPGSAGVNVIASHARLLAGWSYEGVRATGAQLVRVLPFASQVGAGNVDAVRGPWLRGFLEEARGYRGDGSTHDDQVVAAAGAFAALTGPAGAIGAPAPVERVERDVEVREWDDLGDLVQ